MFFQRSAGRMRLFREVEELRIRIEGLTTRLEELQDSHRRFMARAAAREKRAVSEVSSEFAGEPARQPLDPVSQMLLRRRMEERKSKEWATTDGAISSGTSSEPSATSLVPPLPGSRP